MAKQFPTFTHPSLGTPVRLTAAVAKALAQRARQHGHFAKGYDAVSNAHVVEVFCPLCRERVQGYTWAGGQTVTQGLDRAVLEHLAHDCDAVTRP
jgi:hypothetical protein